MKDSQPLPIRSRVVIIGAGIVGISAAYHLAKMGWKDITVLEKGALFQSGSTAHAPGLIGQLSPSRTVTEFAKYSVELYSTLEVENKSAFSPVGSIEVAVGADFWKELQQKKRFADSMALEAYLISPDDIKGKVPTMRTDHLLGGLFIPSDGVVNATSASKALADEAKELGVTFYEHTPVTDLKVTDDQINEVQTPAGNIQADTVLLCAGIWGPAIGEIVGVVVPTVAVQHPYVCTAPLRELEGDKEHPMIRYPEESLYFRKHGERYGLGSYQHKPLLGKVDDIGQTEDVPETLAELPFKEQFFTSLSSASDLFPVLQDMTYDCKLNGLFSLTPDGHSLLGQSQSIHNLWIAEAIWVTHAGGAGKAIAELMVYGESEFDLSKVDVNRFNSKKMTVSDIRAQSLKQYHAIYDWPDV